MSTKQSRENVTPLTQNEDSQQPVSVRLEYFKDSDTPKPSCQNYKTILEWDSRYKNRIWFDEFRGQIMLDFDKNESIWGEVDDIKFWQNMLEWYGCSPSKQREVQQAIQIVAHKNTRHSLQDYLNQCHKSHDKRKTIIDNWLTKYAKAKTVFEYPNGERRDHSKLINAVGRAWLVSLVKRAYFPGSKADSLLILKGAQGTYKSTLLKVLASKSDDDGAFFSDSKLDIGKKDAFINMQGRWIIELPELAELSKRDANTYKAFFTSSTDRFRGVYKGTARDVARSVVFCGTTNDSQFLKDATGNRRFWPIEVQSRTDYEQLMIDREQLWGEAVEAMHSGERSYLTPEQEDEFEDLKKQYLDHHPWHSVIADRVIPVSGVSTKTILKEWLDKDVGSWRKADEMQIADIMRSLGCVKRRTSKGNVWVNA